MREKPVQEEPVRTRAFEPRRFVSFGIVGALSGVVYVAAYLALREPLPPAPANLGALALCTVFNTEANRHWTFGRAAVPRLGLHLRASLYFAVAYAVTTPAVFVLHLVRPEAGKPAEGAVLILVNLLMTVLRFVGLARWVLARADR